MNVSNSFIITDKNLVVHVVTGTSPVFATRITGFKGSGSTFIVIDYQRLGHSQMRNWAHLLHMPTARVLFPLQIWLLGRLLGWVKCTFHLWAIGLCVYRGLWPIWQQLFPQSTSVSSSIPGIAFKSWTYGKGTI